MPCSCQSSSSKLRSGVAVVPESIPHEVLPGESCIFCAEKHASVAYTELQAGASLSIIIGELELARRHTAAEFKNISDRIARVELRAALRDTGLHGDLLSALEAITEVADGEDPSIRTEGDSYEFNSGQEPAANPFIGEIHLCAAYRLAFEVGYMIPNRYMILGDLAMATEHLIRFDYQAGSRMRELRHRVQTTKASDLNIYWPYVVSNITKNITKNIDEYREDYAKPLAKYLGHPDFILKV